jgi:uncharacterized membrane protein YeaQ/YmgE (transglycosylase-associated protein family)
MLLAIALPVGLTFGVATWALMRGRGRGGGLVLSALFGIIGAFVGGLGGQAMGDGSGTSIGLGTVVGGLLASVVEGVAFGRSPKGSASVDHRAGVAIEQPDHGEPVKTIR